MSSPSVYHSSPILLQGERRQINGEIGFQNNNHSRKRRPVDPPEEGSFTQTNADDDYNTANNSTYKRRRTAPPVDDILGAMSLKQPDPPAHSFCSKRKKEHLDVDSAGNASNEMSDSRYTKLPRSSDDVVDDDNDKPQEGGITTLSTTVADTETSLQSSTTSSMTKPDPPGDDVSDNVFATQQTLLSAEMDNDMSVDNMSINSNSDSSISESSIRNAMYDAVFGRRRSMAQIPSSLPPSIGNSGSGHGNVSNGGCCFDAVDSKIEELIRRSRMKAVIQSRKEEEKQLGKREEDGVGNDHDEDNIDEVDEMEMDGE